MSVGNVRQSRAEEQAECGLEFLEWIKTLESLATSGAESVIEGRRRGGQRKTKTLE